MTEMTRRHTPTGAKRQLNMDQCVSSTIDKVHVCMCWSCGTLLHSWYASVRPYVCHFVMCERRSPVALVCECVCGICMRLCAPVVSHITILAAAKA